MRNCNDDKSCYHFNNNIFSLAHTQPRTHANTHPLPDQPDNFGRHFSLAFMTNGGNRGGYLKLFLASKKDAVVQIEVKTLGINEVLLIPGKVNRQYSKTSL